MSARGRGRRWAAVAFAVCLVGLGCTPSAEVPRGLPDPIAEGHGEGACRLLAVEEVEVAVNRSLAGTRTANTREGETAAAETETAGVANGTRDPDADPDDAAPAAAAEPDAAPTADADPDDPARPPRRGRADGPSPLLPGMEMCGLGSPTAGAAWGVLTGSAEEQYRRYVQWHEDYVEPLEVDGHEAVWDPSLRTLLVLADGVAFGITLTADDPVLADHEDEGAYLRDRAVELATRALGRL